MKSNVMVARMVMLLSLLMPMFFGIGGLGVRPAAALNNGLALTPPMGWNSWNKFGCNVTDALVRQMADAMVSSGMAAAGYKYINIDDCWQGTGRTNGHVNLDPDFPNMKALGDYIHSKGLKFGIYSDHGDLTCQGRVGSYGFETTDANDYAAWGVDLLKYDNCNIHPGSNQQQDYERMRNALAASGRPIVFSICAWTYVNWMPATGNLWRTTGDISDNWASMWGIPNGNNASASVAGPGAWSDPDMLEVGNGGMTDTEYRTHMGWWAVMAAPLIAGNDLRSMTQATRDILMASEIVAVDQDSLGVQGTRVWDDGNNLNIWSKRINGTNARAIFLVNGRTTAANITVNWSQIGLPAGNATVRDLWSRQDLGTFNNSFTASNIPAHGSRMLKIVSSSGGPTPTPAGGFNGYYRIVNRTSGKAAAVETASTTNGAWVNQYTYTSTAPSNDEWQLVPTDSGYYKIVNRYSGKVMAIQGALTADGTRLLQWDFGSAQNDQFKPIAMGSYYKLQVRNSGKMLDDSGSGTADGSIIIQWADNGGNNQQWQLISVP